MTVVNIAAPEERILAYCIWLVQHEATACLPRETTEEAWSRFACSAGFSDIRRNDYGRIAKVLRALGAKAYGHGSRIQAEFDGDQIIYSEEDDVHESDRINVLHYEGATLNDLAASMGTPDEWLGTAISHLKAASCEQNTPFIKVSDAAVSLLLYRIEQLEHGGEPWKGNPE